jgi:hypothetical protein
MRQIPIQATLGFLCLLHLLHLSLVAVEESDRLCPNRIASLMTIPGNLDSLTASQRVEIRQCPLDVNTGSGWFQLVAWQKDAATPSLILNAEDSGFKQFVMIEGVYVIQLIGGTAYITLGITFETGNPTLAFQESSKEAPIIQSSSSEVIVELVNVRSVKRRYVLRRSESGARRQ